MPTFLLTARCFGATTVARVIVTSSASLEILPMFARTFPAALGLVAALAIPTFAHAQAADVYGGEDLSSPPKLVSPAATARLIARSMPEDLRRANVSGTVQIMFTINKDGHVEPSSIEVVSASTPSLAGAAKSVVEKMEFVPGKKDGSAVRARVQLPITYKP